jgi:mannose-6-phosphate isomerase-like protein (cupin superfamily)
MKKVVKPWGVEEWWAEVPDKYLAKILRVNPGESLSLQYHEEKVETMMVVSGIGTILIGLTQDDLKVMPMVPGSQFTIPAGVLHQVMNTGEDEDLVILEASTYHPDDVVRVADRYDRVE